MDSNCSELLSTRLFPKDLGANAVVLTGLASRCDWVITSDSQSPLVELRRLCGNGQPRTIFLSLRQPFAALTFMATEVLPQLREPFVLISGSEDVTLPLQCDHRWRPFTAAEDQQILQIACHPLLQRWYAENLDWPFAAALAPLPLGVLPPTAGQPGNSILHLATSPPPLAERELLVLCAHRVREGPQWATRLQLSEQLLALNHPWLLVVTEELSADAYVQLLRRCSFVICASGGGWDPCPKMWHALLHGAIPIVKSGALDPVLAPLPVWTVGDWREVDWGIANLESQRQSLIQSRTHLEMVEEELSLRAWQTRVGLA